MTIKLFYMEETVRRVAELASQGFTDQEIADTIKGLAYHHVTYIRKIRGITAGGKLARRNMPSEEWAQICVLRRAGATWDDLGKQFLRHPTTLAERYLKQFPIYSKAPSAVPAQAKPKSSADVKREEIRALAARNFKWPQIAAMTRTPYREVREILGVAT